LIHPDEHAREKKNRTVAINKSMNRDRRRNHLFTPVQTELIDVGARVSKEVHYGVSDTHTFPTPYT